MNILSYYYYYYSLGWALAGECYLSVKSVVCEHCFVGSILCLLTDVF